MVSSGPDLNQALNFRGPAYVWDVTNVATNGSGPIITLAITGNDPYGLVPNGILRPTSGTLFSFFNDLIERRSAKVEGKSMCGVDGVFAEFRLRDQVLSIEGVSQFNYDPNIREAIRFPGTGTVSASSHVQTFQETITSRQILVVRVNKQQPYQKFSEIRYYYNVGIEPSDEPLSGFEAEGQRFFGLVGVATDDDGVPLSDLRCNLTQYCVWDSATDAAVLVTP